MLLSFLQGIFDILFPKDAATEEIEKFTPQAFSLRVRPAELPYHSSYHAFFSYKDPLVKKTVLLFKYHRNTRATKLIAELLSERLLEEISETALLSGSAPLLIPIPMAQGRKKRRGGNHMERLVQDIAQVTGNSFPLELNNLKRIRETPPQASIKDRRLRITNVKGVFQVMFPERIAGKTILLLDDVATTGATLSEAKKILSEAGAKKVECVAFAH